MHQTTFTVSRPPLSDDPTLFKPTRDAPTNSLSTIAISSLSLSSIASSNFSHQDLLDTDTKPIQIDTPLPVKSYPDSTELRKKQLKSHYTLTTLAKSLNNNSDTVKQTLTPRSVNDLPVHEWKHERAQEFDSVRKVRDWLQSGTVYDDSDEEDMYYNVEIEDSVMHEDDGVAKVPSQTKQEVIPQLAFPSPITESDTSPIQILLHNPSTQSLQPLAVDAPPQDHVQDQDYFARSINSFASHRSATSDVSSGLNDDEFRELQQVLALSLIEARERVKYNHAQQHVGFVEKEEVIPSSDECSNVDENGSDGVQEVEQKLVVKSRPRITAEEYDEDVALMMAIEMSRREFEERMMSSVGMGMDEEFGSDVENDRACYYAATEEEDSHHDKKWKGKERAF
ncbi:hypothetical protein HDU99_001784 [Rhizoclosmatium hyalinum]|nr:hypothetical protein HDU99_001784 [Rhizoclosmatium hyalinum]